LEFELNDDSKYIVICSDGVWEFLDNQRVMNLVTPFYNKNDPEGACNVLVKESIEWWEREDSVIDDITCIVIFL
jgi:serine/threonine protein phosphatase PrpC